jgi:hypothetical protein
VIQTKSDNNNFNDNFEIKFNCNLIEMLFYKEEKEKNDKYRLPLIITSKNINKSYNNGILDITK